MPRAHSGNVVVHILGGEAPPSPPPAPPSPPPPPPPGSPPSSVASDTASATSNTASTTSDAASAAGDTGSITSSTSESSLCLLPGPPSQTPPAVPECRFCFEPALAGDPLIAPCLCSGSSKFVHDRCLRKWRLMNYGRAPFVRCMECRAAYRIRYRWPRETYRFTPAQVSQVAGNARTLFLSFTCLFAALFLRTLDKAAGYQLARGILDPYPDKTFIHLVVSDTVYAVLFYFSAIAWVMTTLLYILLPTVILPNIRHHDRYVKTAILPAIGSYVLSLHFFWLYYFCKALDPQSPEAYINLELALATVNLWTPRYLMQLHNKCVDGLNRSNYGAVLDRVVGDRIVVV